MQAFWVAMGSFSSFALAIVSAAVLSRYFDKAEYGTYRQVLYVYNTLLLIFSAGLPRVYSYYLPRCTMGQGRKVVEKINRLLLLLGTIFSLCLYLSSDLIAALLNNPELSPGLKLFSPVPVMLLPTLGIEGIFASYKKTWFIALYNTVTRLLMLLFIVAPVVLWHGTYIHAIYGWLVASGFSLIIAFYFKGIPFRGVEEEKSNLTSREILSYSLPLLAASLAGIAIRSADQFYISRFFGAEVFAVFSNGFIELPFVGMVTAATSAVLFPEFSRILSGNGDRAAIVDLWRSALLKSAMLIYPLVIFFMFNAQPVVELLFTNNYADSVSYFRLAMVVNFFHIIIFSPLIMANGSVRFYSVVHFVIAIIIWVGEGIVVLTINEPMGIAVFSVFIAVAKVVFFSWYAARLIDVGFFDLFPVKKLSCIVIHCTIVVAISCLVSGLIFREAFVAGELLLGFICFASLLLLTASLFGLDYFSVIRPIYGRFFNKRV